MSTFIKISEPLLYQVQGSYQFLICNEMRFEPETMQTELKGKLYSYESEELMFLGVAEVVLDNSENTVALLDENGKWID